MTDSVTIHQVSVIVLFAIAGGALGLILSDILWLFYSLYRFYGQKKQCRKYN
jgi:hypothetical protein